MLIAVGLLSSSCAHRQSPAADTSVGAEKSNPPRAVDQTDEASIFIELAGSPSRWISPDDLIAKAREFGTREFPDFVFAGAHVALWVHRAEGELGEVHFSHGMGDGMLMVVFDGAGDPVSSEVAHVVD